jgi:hypothetical protein
MTVYGYGKPDSYQYVPLVGSMVKCVPARIGRVACVLIEVRGERVIVDPEPFISQINSAVADAEIQS